MMKTKQRRWRVFQPHLANFRYHLPRMRWLVIGLHKQRYYKKNFSLRLAVALSQLLCLQWSRLHGKESPGVCHHASRLEGIWHIYAVFDLAADWSLVKIWLFFKLFALRIKRRIYKVHTKFFQNFLFHHHRMMNCPGFVKKKWRF